MDGRFFLSQDNIRPARHMSLPCYVSPGIEDEKISIAAGKNFQKMILFPAVNE